MEEHKALKIINASAGSGKTYRLVKEYLKLVLRESDTHCFQHILAMTFTNKAALEMKERVLLALDQIANPEIYDFKAASLASDLCKELNLKDDDLQSRCSKILGQILHQFEDFSVMTIDKFNARLIKSFSKDLDLPADYEIVFNSDELLGNVVDQLLAKLGRKEYEELNKLIFQFARSKVENGENWNFRKELIDFSKILENERYSDLIEELLKQSFRIDDYKALRAEIKTVENRFKEKIDPLLSALENANPEDFHGGSRTLGSAIKSLREFNQQGKDFFTATLYKILNGETKKELPSHLLELFQAFLGVWDEHSLKYFRLKVQERNFFNMALLKYVAETLKELRNQERILRISEFTSLVADLIKEEDAPYIYERLGTRYSNYLLDEFQDTSLMQWRNLLPLVQNALGDGNLNLIVGDAKQSIYRFKNGLAEQFVALPKVYNPNGDKRIEQISTFFNSMGAKEELDSNWRSSPTIVEFNNRFFELLRDKLSPKGQEFYGALKQKAMGNMTGRVLIYSNEKDETELDDLDFLLEQIENCEKEGFRRSDICILGTKNKTCNTWAVGLSDHGYQVVSSESLLIDSDASVRTMMAYLKLRKNPEGLTEQKVFASLFSGLKKEAPDYLSFIRAEKRSFDFESYIQFCFPDKEFHQFAFASLYDLVQQVYALLDLNELTNVYLHRFSDVVFEYEAKHGPDLAGFIDYYASKSSKLAVQVPPSDEALTIMTIHKSKGLEFPVVIIPNLKFRGSNSMNTLFKSADKLLYKNLTQNEVLPEAIAIYEEESDQILLDQVNAIYVAMTRPIEKLVLRNKAEKEKLNKLFHETLKEIPESKIDGDEIVLDIGKIKDRTIESKSQEDTIQAKHLREMLWFPDIALQDQDELNDANYLQEDRQFGIQMHLLLSKCSLNSEESISETLNELIADGQIALENEERLLKGAQQIIANASYKELHKGKIDSWNERSILLPTGEEIIPDRVIFKANETIVIDYKTGSNRKKSYEQQVLRYKTALSEMNFPEVKAYLYYTEDLELVTV